MLEDIVILLQIGLKENLSIIFSQLLIWLNPSNYYYFFKFVVKLGYYGI